MTGARAAASGRVVWDVTMSLDGFIAGPDDRPGRIFDWYFGGNTRSVHYSKALPFRLSKEDARVFDEGARTLGAIVAGRRTYDLANGWSGSFFMPVPFFVLTHRSPTEAPGGTTKFTFVTDGVRSAVRQAKKAARGKDVGVMGANAARECLEAGLLDAITVHVAPCLLGEGVRLFERPGARPIDLERTEVTSSPSGMTHISFSVKG